jgi:AcrR family transcriptional regulator
MPDSSDKRRRIMQAAESLFASRRFHEITTDAVARLAGVGKGTIYRFFEDKDHLFFETAHAGFDELCELLLRNVAADSTFDRQLLQACVEISGFFRRRRQLFELMQAQERGGCLNDPRLRRLWMHKRKALVEAVGGIIARGVAKGAIRADVPPPVLANFLLAMLRTRARDLEDASAAHKSHEAIVDVFCNGAAPRNRLRGRRL